MDSNAVISKIDLEENICYIKHNRGEPNGFKMKTMPVQYEQKDHISEDVTSPSLYMSLTECSGEMPQFIVSL